MKGAQCWLGPRRFALLGILLVGVLSAWLIQLDPALLFGKAQWHQLGDFFKAALRPAMTYEDQNPATEGVFLGEIWVALYKTLVYTAAAVGLSLVGGLVFGLIGSTRAWLALASPAKPLRIVSLSGLFLVRLVMTALRSVHEIIWAILFLQALGNVPLAAVIAIAIPYSATLGKVFSELIDEAPRATAEGLRANGASALQVYVFGLLPTVLPDLFAYLLYRFECGLRSAAVLGFFGAPTLGYYLSLSWGERHFHEVWAYLYALLALIVVFDLWSGAVRQRLTTRHAA